MPENSAPPSGPPQRRARRQVAEAIPVGTEVFYRLRRTLMLINAVVIDTWHDDDGATPLKRPRPGTAHLEIELDPEVHFSGSDRGLRQHVPEGDGPGMWRRDWPVNEQAEWEAREYKRQIIEEEHVRQAQGRAL